MKHALFAAPLLLAMAGCAVPGGGTKVARADRPCVMQTGSLMCVPADDVNPAMSGHIPDPALGQFSPNTYGGTIGYSANHTGR